MILQPQILQLIISVLQILESCSGNLPEDIVVETSSGKIRGYPYTLKGGFTGYRFLGIPYALPPTGKLRFNIPKSVPPWEGVLDARKFGPICLQPLETDVWDMEPTDSNHLEDQLYQHLREKSEPQLPKDFEDQISKIEEYFQKIRKRIPNSIFTENQTNFSENTANGSSASFQKVNIDRDGRYTNSNQAFPFDDPNDEVDSVPYFQKKKLIKEYEMSEDCLSLNIYTPSIDVEPSDRFPVIVFIHGGSFYTNGGRLYPGERLSAEGIIVVTLNYRLGPFGFMSTANKDARGNWGLLDQRLALQWVQDHIGSFHGDADRTLIVGNSAGGASVVLHLLSPLSKGLFSRVAAMSGCALAPWSIQLNPLKTARKLASGLHCPTENTADLVECMRQKSANSINQEFTKNVIQDGLWLAFAPVVEGDFPGAFLPKSPQVVLKNGTFERLPLLMMLTRDEVTIWFRTVPKTMQKKGIENWMDEVIKGIFNNLDSCNLKTVSHVIRGFYIYESGFQPSSSNPESSMEEVPVTTIANLFSDVGLRVPCVEETKILSSWVPVYLAEFSYASTDDVRIRNKNWIGSYHESDLQYIFGQPLFGIRNSLRDESDAKVAEIAMNVIKTFADSGIPSLPSLKNSSWLPYTVKDETHLEISSSPILKKGYHKKRQHFWVHFLPLLTKWPREKSISCGTEEIKSRLIFYFASIFVHRMLR